MNTKILQIALFVLVVLLLVASGFFFFWLGEAEKPIAQEQLSALSATTIVISQAEEETKTASPPTLTPTPTSKATTLPETTTDIATSESPIPIPTPVLATDTPTPTFTPEPPTNTPTFDSSSTSPPVSETPNSGEVKYSAEKISLAPVDLSLDLPGISTQDNKLNNLKIGIKNWSSNGQKLTFVIPSPEVLIDPTAPEEYDNRYTASELWVANIDGTNPQKIAEQTGGLALWSPDDTRLAYYKQIGIFSREIWVADLRSNTSTKLSEPSGIDINNGNYYGSIDWLDNEHLIYGTYSQAGERFLWLHEVLENQIQEIFVDDRLGDTWSSFWLSPNKVSIIGNTLNDLWLGELVEKDGQFRVDYVKSVLSEDSLMPTWSPNGAKVAIKSYGLSAQLLRILEINTGNIVEIPIGARVAGVEWLPGDEVVIVSHHSTGTELPVNIYTINADGSKQTLLTSSPSGNFEVSPDGQFIELNSVAENASGNDLNVFKIEIAQ